MANDRAHNSVSPNLGSRTDVTSRPAGAVLRLVADDVAPAWVEVSLARRAAGKRSCEAGRQVEPTIHNVVGRSLSTVLTAHDATRRT